MNRIDAALDHLRTLPADGVLVTIEEAREISDRTGGSLQVGKPWFRTRTAPLIHPDTVLIYLEVLPQPRTAEILGRIILEHLAALQEDGADTAHLGALLGDTGTFTLGDALKAWGRAARER